MNAINNGAAIRLFSDGACQGNPGPGGWAWAIDGGPNASGCESPSTNQRMEVWAVLDGLQTMLPAIHDEPDQFITVVSDSTYVVNCFQKRWYAGWQSRGWKNAQKQPVANQDLWKPLIDLYLRHQGQVRFEWVKGHSGNPMNDRVDALAVEAAARQVGRVFDDPSGWLLSAEPAATLDESSQQSLF
jgi:ribonuclease HI